MNVFSQTDAKIVKTVIIGSYGVGKSSIANRILHDTFNTNEPTTIGLDFFCRFFNDIQTKLHIWDTAGHERFNAVTQSYYRLADVYIIVFNVCDRASFDAIPMYIQTSRDCKPESPIIILGNMAHENESANRVVLQSETEHWKNNIEDDIIYFELSAKYDSIDKIIDIFKIVASKGTNKNYNQTNQKIYLEQPKKQQNKCCF